MPGRDQLDINAWLNHREPEDVDGNSSSCRPSCKFSRFEDLGWRTSVVHRLEAAPSPSTGSRFSHVRVSSPGLSLSPARAQPEPSTRARLRVFVSLSPAKPSP